MAYLVQTRFKNFFKDFRTQDVDYFENLDDAEPEYYDECVKAFHVLSTEKLKELEAEFDVLGLGIQTVKGHNEMIEEKRRVIHMNGDRTEVRVYAAIAKVWTLQDGSNIGSATPYYYLDGHWLKKAELKSTFDALFEELEIEDEANDLVFEPTIDGYRQFKTEALKIRDSSFLFDKNHEVSTLYEFLTGKDFYRLNDVRRKKVEAEMNEMLESL